MTWYLSLGIGIKNITGEIRKAKNLGQKGWQEYEVAVKIFFDCL